MYIVSCIVASGYNIVEGEKYLGEMPSNNLCYSAADHRGARHRHQQQERLGGGADTSRHLSRRRYEGPHIKMT